MIYDGNLTVKEGLRLYFIRNGFGGPNYNDKWVKLKLGPIPLAFPNSDARRRAVRYHDIHHVLTEYPTTLEGEACIGAWELASGCGPHLPAWILNSLAVFLGMIVCPIKTVKAFVKGRKCSNLFLYEYNDILLNQTIRSLREELKISV